MSRSYRVSSEERNAIYKIRDALILGGNSLSPDEIQSLGRELDQLLVDMEEDFSGNRNDDSESDRKKTAIAIGILCQGIDDLGDVAGRERSGVNLEAKRRMAKAGGVSRYAGRLKDEGLRTINKLGFSKKDIKVMEFD